MDTLYTLAERLEHLSARQSHLTEEINALRSEIARLQRTEVKPAAPKPAPVVTVVTPPAPKPQPVKKKEKSDIEKFIGENLISKIGIIITVIGIAIGAKYSIDHQLISPTARIIIGYLFGIGLLGTAFYLRKKYVNFSAVLLSGSMAIMYFITFSAYEFYALIPQAAAFALMFVFTVFTALAALRYDRQVIAHIGMVGAYAVPLLLGNNSGDVLTLFIYVSIINLGILALSFIKYWKSLFYAAFALTWLIYVVWYVNVFDNAYFTIKLVFSSIFFVTFYAMFVCYKLLGKHKYNAGDIAVLLANTFIFYGYNYATLNSNAEHLLGLFTLINAAVHFAVGVLIYRRKLADRNLFYLVIGLMLIFVTIAVPVQLSGSGITLLWVGEAALLFWIGRTKAAPVYEKMSFVPLVLACVSLLIDWFRRSSNEPVFINVWLLGSLLFVAAALFIVFISRKYPATALPKEWARILPDDLDKIIPVTAAIAGLIALYYAFFAEIYFCFTDANPYFRNIWLVCYTLFFTSALSAFNFWKLKNKTFSYVLLGLNVFAVIIFLTVGLYSLSELRKCYFIEPSFFNIGIRYIACLFAAAILYIIYRQARKLSLSIPAEILLHIAVLWTASSELIHWLDIAGVQSYKIGLSILWGIYSLALIALGILKQKKYLRISAIALFGVTLVKLFFYDISHLDTIAKTVVFVALGVLLLGISFLYNKFKHRIAEENANA
ncbi:MAG: DUF2339 domain-containing protein [Prevotellaceae bacterium]|jgi:uncharacterized membrane protein|nr:DUF2339 domain-containing protein [Prevotellaceae bacterium]